MRALGCIIKYNYKHIVATFVLYSVLYKSGVLPNITQNTCIC